MFDSCEYLILLLLVSHKHTLLFVEIVILILSDSHKVLNAVIGLHGWHHRFRKVEHNQEIAQLLSLKAIIMTWDFTDTNKVLGKLQKAHFFLKRQIFKWLTISFDEVRLVEMLGSEGLFLNRKREVMTRL